ncbi:MAG TPA: Ig-like domain-containing protein [Gemmatimonadales bacterium]|nr:Ig-like domain-containing protein [Gemmatimonadales bacterium]
MRMSLGAILVAVGATGCLGIADLPPDTLAPQVEITSPVNGTTVGGGVPVQVGAADDFSVEVVRILIDGTLRATIYTRPYRLLWGTLGLPNNSVHTIVAEAVDPSNNVGRAQVSVSVFNTKE